MQEQKPNGHLKENGEDLSFEQLRADIEEYQSTKELIEYLSKKYGFDR